MRRENYEERQKLLLTYCFKYLLIAEFRFVKKRCCVLIWVTKILMWAILSSHAGGRFPTPINDYYPVRRLDVQQDSRFSTASIYPKTAISGNRMLKRISNPKRFTQYFMDSGCGVSYGHFWPLGECCNHHLLSLEVLLSFVSCLRLYLCIG